VLAIGAIIAIWWVAANAVPVNAAPANPPTVAKVERRSSEFWTGLLGIIIGAGVAYFSDWLKEWRKKRNDQHGAIVRAQLALIGQLNTIENLDRQFLGPLRENPQRDRKLISFDMHDTSLRVDYNAISFFLTAKNPTLVLDVHAAEESYLTTMDALRLRNESFVRLHENSDVQDMNLQTGHVTVAVKDVRDLKMLKDRTDSLYTAVARAQERLDAQIKELYGAGKALYPKRNFLQIEGKK
jgi:hypothetical protein